MPVRSTHFSMGGRESPAFPQLLPLPAFITPVELASRLDVTLPKLSKDARHYFEWWPRDITRRRSLRTGYNNVKNLILNYDEASQIARLFHRQPHLQVMEGTDLQRSLPPLYQHRPPVIAIIGHKDHGKTSLLDSLRGTKVAQREAFGITQETYSHTVVLDRDTIESERRCHRANAPVRGDRRAFTFLDTPGHYSFSEMRVSAVSHADLVMLVVSADEGLLDQTFECLNIITDFKLPVLLVITKIDLPQSKPELIRKHLQKLGAKLVPYDKPSISTKGEIVAIELSVKENVNLDQLRQSLFSINDLLISKHLLENDVNDLPTGSVIESWREEKGRGHVVKVLLNKGTLKIGDHFVCDISLGRVKDLRDSNGVRVSEITAGIPCEIMGLDGLPVPSADFLACSKAAASEIVNVRRLEMEYKSQPRLLSNGREEDQVEDDDAQSQLASGMKSTKKVQQHFVRPNSPPSPSHSQSPRSKAPASPSSSQSELPRWIEDGVEYESLPVIVKANTVGSLRMLHDSIDRINAQHGIGELINVVDANVGTVTKSDIHYAMAWECPIYGFNVETPSRNEKLALSKHKITFINYQHHEHLIADIYTNMQKLHQQRKADSSQATVSEVVNGESKSEDHDSGQAEFDVDDWRRYVNDDDVSVQSTQTQTP